MAALTFFESLMRYALTRLLTMRVGALLLLALLASIAASPMITPDEMAATGLLLTLLIFQFRLWDDLADLPFDRDHFPQRVLAQREQHQLFYLAVALLAAVAGGMIFVWRTGLQFLIYLLLLTSFVFIYRRLASAKIPRIVRTHLVLLKYPAFIFIAPPAGKLYLAAWVAATVYFCLTVFDLFSDPALTRFTARRWIISVEVMLLLLLLGIGLWMQ